MGVYSALNIGNTGLLASQRALEVVGNNIANATTPGYSRQDVVLIPGPAVGEAIKMGTGVRVTQVLRRFDAAVESRLRHAMADSESWQVQRQTLDRIEGLYNETTDQDLSSALTAFFNGFAELANNPQDLGVRTIVIERTRHLVEAIKRLRSNMDGLRQELNASVLTGIQEVNRLAAEVAALNVRVLQAEEGRLESAPSLRDERDAKLRELAQWIDIRTVEQNSGAVNVIVGNQILVDGRYSRQLTTRTVEDRNLGVGEIRFTDNDELLALNGGRLAGYVAGRDVWLGQQIDSLDVLARNLIFEVNCLHAEGTGTQLLSSTRSELRVLDASAVLNSVEAGLPYAPVNGSFLLHVTNSVSGFTETLTIDVDLDGLGADDSLNDVVARINALATAQGINVAASVDSYGRLTIGGTSSEVRISFSEDTSHLLGAMGVNALFGGHDALTIGLSTAIVDNPRLLAAGLSGASGDNANALRLSNLAETPVDGLFGSNLLDYHKQAVTNLAVNAAAAKSSSGASDAFLATMQDEREAVSGVNLDEESVNLIRYQKAYVAAARFMSVMAQLLDKIMEI